MDVPALDLRVCIHCAHLCSVLGDAAQPVCVTSGQDATLTWQLLSRHLWHGVIVISLDNPQNIVFMASLVGNQLVNPLLMSGYQDTVNVSDTLIDGYIRVSISNVTARHAGTYLCLRGLSGKDIIPNCGQRLNVIEAPQEARVTALGVAVEGHNLTLRCTASSASKPRDQHRPMVFRWFDSADGDGRAVSEIIPADHLNASSAETSEPKPVALGPADGVDEHSASRINLTSQTITLQFTRKSDEGRQFACSASEGLGLWSEWSDRYTVHLQGAPSAEDLRLDPPDGTIDLTSGSSVNLTCSVSTCRPACDITWEKVISKKTSIPLQKGHTLTLKNVSLVEEGVYACAASNEHGRVSKTIVVHVVGKEESSSSEPLISDHNRLAVILVVVSTIGLALGITGVAYIVYTWRRQRQQHPARWRPRRLGSDVVPLSSMKR
ncbi:hypothetical protein C0Q70_12398 [Pomacea canaliculata]|uniref:Ig-like domain-containing protein n=1 Tax=Pomacea canaliculata TaxID=400727 RepID=A0A2T7P1G0_POMCA|nr:hypothetical protein C0Q70_12398 [Pomacea canaliculata]